MPTLICHHAKKLMMTIMAKLSDIFTVKPRSTLTLDILQRQPSTFLRAQYSAISSYCIAWNSKPSSENASATPWTLSVYQKFLRIDLINIAFLKFDSITAGVDCDIDKFLADRNIAIVISRNLSNKETIGFRELMCLQDSTLKS